MCTAVLNSSTGRARSEHRPCSRLKFCSIECSPWNGRAHLVHGRAHYQHGPCKERAQAVLKTQDLQHWRRALEWPCTSQARPCTWQARAVQKWTRPCRLIWSAKDKGDFKYKFKSSRGAINRHLETFTFTFIFTFTPSLRNPSTPPYPLHLSSLSLPGDLSSIQGSSQYAFRLRVYDIVYKRVLLF